MRKGREGGLMAESHCAVLGNYFITYLRFFCFFHKEDKDKYKEVRKEVRMSVKQMGRFTDKAQ